MNGDPAQLRAEADVRERQGKSGPDAVTVWIDTHTLQAFGALTLFYGIVTAALSHFKLLWLDELITLHIARLGSIRAIWHALAQGADPNPPLTHIAVLTSMRLFGLHTYALRLPAVIGYWVGMLSLFLFLKRHLSATWALLGVLISMGMGGFEWSYESRSYAIFYGTTMLGLYLWSRSVDPAEQQKPRLYALAGMVLALAAGLCANYFSVLAFVPIAAGEFTRSWRRSRTASIRTQKPSFLASVYWPVWLGLVLAGTPLLIFRKFAERAIALYAPYAWNKVNFDSTNIAYTDMVEAMLWPLGCLALICGVFYLLSRLCNLCQARLRPRWLGSIAGAVDNSWQGTRLPPPHELTAIFVLMIYPYLGWALASLHGGMLSARFVIPVCFGFASAAALLLSRTFRRLRYAGPALLLSFLLWFMVRESYVGFSYNEEKTALFSTYAALRTEDHFDEPIVVSDNLLVLPFQYYAPPDVARRVVYPIDMKAIMNRRHEASGEVNLWLGRYSYGFPILPLAVFQHHVSTYLLVTSEPDWLLDDLHAHHYADDILPDDTHAEPLNYVATPLSHFKSQIYRVFGDQFAGDNYQPDPTHDGTCEPCDAADLKPTPFSLAGELPTSR